MKLRIHYLILFSCLLVMLPLTSGSSYAQSLTAITESDIQAMMSGMERAARKGNVAGIIAPFAPDIKIKLSVLNPGSDKEQEATLTKEQFAFNARRNLRRKLSYQFERKNTRIKIYDAETAMATYDVYETFRFPEGTLRSASSEVLYVSLHDGKLVITGMETRMRVY
jgi:hypothetical protein